MRLFPKLRQQETPFGEKYKTRHGIATLKNDIYIFKPVDEDNDYFYFFKMVVYTQ